MSRIELTGTWDSFYQLVGEADLRANAGPVVNIVRFQHLWLQGPVFPGLVLVNWFVVGQSFRPSGGLSCVPD